MKPPAVHGHKHRAQFARIDWSPAAAERYPLVVAAAGSAALRTPNNPFGNSFHLITIHDNGRIEGESLHYGAGTAPNREGRKGEDIKSCPETIESTKRRASSAPASATRSCAAGGCCNSKSARSAISMWCIGGAHAAAQQNRRAPVPAHRARPAAWPARPRP